MSTTLPHGIIQINEGNISWYGDITANWQLIDSKIGVYDAAVASIPAPANNGTLTINYGGTTLAMFGADDAGNVSADIPTPGDGTLTIRLNGSDVQTFTANASTNATANIQCVDLTNNQTVAGNKEFTGTTTAHDLVPSATDTYNFGSSSAQWNNAYIKSLTINGVAGGDILTHNVSEFVNVSTAQTIGGNKSFTGSVIFNPYRAQIKSSSQEIGVVPSSNQWNGITFTDKNNRNTFSIEQAFMPNGNTMTHFSMTPNIANGSPLRIFESTYIASTAEIVTKSRTLIPDANNSRDLGTSTNKWKSIYSNTYYLGNTAFGNIVTHNASEFALVSDLATVATSGSYNDLSNKPTVNDGTLTIMVDGITAGTFSANQSSNSVIELTSGGGGGGSADVRPMSVSIAHSIAASVFGE